MQVFFVRSYKKKIPYILLMLILLYVVTLLAPDVCVNMTINNQLTFLCPTKYTIGDILINESLRKNTIEANYSMAGYVAQRFSTYTSMKGQFTFDYPTAFELSEENFNGAEVLYHIGFNDKNRPVHGFIQVWNMPYLLESFLEQSKSTSIQNYTSFTSQPIMVDNNEGILWRYNVVTQEEYCGLEVFWKTKGKMYRISYFLPLRLWSEDEYNTFLHIVKSFKVLE